MLKFLAQNQFLVLYFCAMEVDIVKLRSELRAGNIIGHNDSPWREISFLISHFHKDQTRAMPIHGRKHLCDIRIHDKNLKPVPITERRLKVLGFKETKKGIWEMNGSRVKYYPEYCDVKIIEQSKMLHYVHELQNFYFKEKEEELPLPFLNPT
jgi:hypothetical protein